MDTIIDAVAYLLFPIVYVTNPQSQFFIPTYLTSLILAYLVMRYLRGSSLVGTKKDYLFFPAQMFAGISAWLDLKLLFLNIYYTLIQLTVVGGATFVTVAGMTSLFELLFGPATIAVAPSLAITAITMALVFLAHEFGYWSVHYLSHKIPFMWEFHKVHHSAEELSPLTEFRQHPFETSLSAFFMTTLAALVQGPMIYFYGAGSMMLNPLEQNIITLFFYYTIIHWRHTDLPIYLPGIWAKLIQAPTHHQVHHSDNPKHFDKNLGYCLSIFDWMFGTLYVPQKDEKIVYGIGEHDAAFDTLTGSLVAPIKRAGTYIKRARTKTIE